MLESQREFPRFPLRRAGFSARPSGEVIVVFSSSPCVENTRLPDDCAPY